MARQAVGGKLAARRESAWAPATGRVARLVGFRRRWPRDVTLLPIALALLCNGLLGGPAAPPALAADPAAASQPLYLPLLSPALRRADPPSFSRQRGLVDQAFLLHLSSPAGLSIRYSLDGSAPSPGRGLVYAAPIAITTSTVVRALAYGGGLAPSPVASHSYLLPEAIFRQGPAPAGWPTDWGVDPEVPASGPVDADYAMDPRLVTDPRYTSRLRPALMALPSLSLGLDPEDLLGEERGIYRHSLAEGAAWERPVSVELLRGDGGAGFQVDAGIRLAGVASRHHQFTRKHSFSLRFRSRYGSKRLEHPLFPDDGAGRFDSLRLRAGFNDSFAFVPWRGQYLRDRWGRESQAAMGGLAPRGRFVHLFLNGLYWGLYELTEEPTAAFTADHLGGREEDYDVVKSDERGEGGVEDGGRQAYEQLRSLDGLEDPVRYGQVAQLLDIPAFADYMLLNIYALNLDWQANWRAARNRATGGGFRFLPWDMEISLDLLQHGHRLYDPSREDDMSVTAGVDGLHDRLMRSPEYRQTFADRARLHLFGDGALTDDAAASRYRRLAAEISQPMLLEAARWGDSPPGSLALRDGGLLWSAFFLQRGEGAAQTVDLDWSPERDRLLSDFFPRRRDRVLWQLCDRVLFPPLVAPLLEPAGGVLYPGSRVVLRPDAGGCPGADRRGTLYYTTDGSDPRVPGSGHVDIPWSGRIAHTAQVYRSPLALDGYRVIRTRSALMDRGNLIWSALTEGVYGSPRLAFDEVHYQPLESEGRTEFVELLNLEHQPVDLSGASTRGITFTFPAGSLLPPGGRAVLVRDPEAFGLRHPTAAVTGVYGGRLADEGETLGLVAADGQTLLAQATYEQGPFWPQAPAGRGYSLQRAGEAHALPPAGDPDAWRAGSRPGGSPGQADPPPPHGPIWITELLPRPLPGEAPAVELYNAGSAAVDLAGWWLGEGPERPRRLRLPPGWTLAPNEHRVLRLDASPAGPGEATGPGLRLQPGGGLVSLSGSDALGQPSGFLAGFPYGPARPGQSIGRLATGAGPVAAPLVQPSLGGAAPSSGYPDPIGWPSQGQASIGPLVISEIHYHPEDSLEPEWLEIQNLGAEPLALDGGSRQPGAAALPWRLAGGLRFAFPQGAALAPGQRALITGGDPRFLRSSRRLPADLPIWGPWEGRLDNAGETLTLGQPSDADPAGGLIAADRVVYRPGAPWPAAPDGGGPSLERTSPLRWGEDPAAWRAGPQGGSPGEDSPPSRRLSLPLLIRGR